MATSALSSNCGLFSAGSILALRNNRAAGFHDLGGANAAEDAISKTHVVNNCAGEMSFNHRGHRGRHKMKLSVVEIDSQHRFFQLGDAGEKVGSGLRFAILLQS